MDNNRRDLMEKMFDKGLKHGYSARDKKIVLVRLKKNHDERILQSYNAGVAAGNEKRRLVMIDLMIRELEDRGMTVSKND